MTLSPAAFQSLGFDSHAAATLDSLMRRSLLLRSPDALGRASTCASPLGTFVAAAPLPSWQLPWLLANPSQVVPYAPLFWLERDVTALLLALPRTSGAGVLIRHAWARMVEALHGCALRRGGNTPVRVAHVHDALWSVAQRLSADWGLDCDVAGTTWAHELACVIEMALALAGQDDAYAAVHTALADVYARVSADLTVRTPDTTTH